MGVIIAQDTAALEVISGPVGARWQFFVFHGMRVAFVPEHTRLLDGVAYGFRPLLHFLLLPQMCGMRANACAARAFCQLLFGGDGQRVAFAKFHFALRARVLPVSVNSIRSGQRV